MNTDASGKPLCSVERAGTATDAEHVAARDTTPCRICGAAPGVECTYGALAGGLPEQFPGRVHTRRLRQYLGALEVVVRWTSRADEAARADAKS